MGDAFLVITLTFFFKPTVVIYEQGDDELNKAGCLRIRSHGLEKLISASLV